MKKYSLASLSGGLAVLIRPVALISAVSLIALAAVTTELSTQRQPDPEPIGP